MLLNIAYFYFFETYRKPKQRKRNIKQKECLFFIPPYLILSLSWYILLSSYSYFLQPMLMKHSLDGLLNFMTMISFATSIVTKTCGSTNGGEKRIWLLSSILLKKPYHDKDFFPNIRVLLSIMATLPVTSCECERSISMLKLIFKNPLRSTMKQDN